MIGDAYFQLRAQVGTALFSLLRLATEAGACDGSLTALRSAQAGLRESFLFLTLGPSGSGKSTLFNSLFERQFCGAAEPAASEKTAVFQYSDEARDETRSAGLVVCHRPHIFLRDFTIVDAASPALPGLAPLENLDPYLLRADVIFYVVSAAGRANAETWEFLQRLSRELLRRVVFVVWQSDRVSPDEGANTVKRLRQGMLKNLAHACPIFAASENDRGSREKLVRWIENQIIFSEPRRTRLSDIDRLAHEALREIAGKPAATEQVWQRNAVQLRHLREDLAEREEQSQRQIAGLLWSMAQSFDALRERGEFLLASDLRLLKVVKGDLSWLPQLASEVETQSRESLNVQTEDAIDALESDLRHSAADHDEACRKLLPGEAVRPLISRQEIADAVKKLDRPLDLTPLLAAEVTRAALLLRLPALAAAGAFAVVLGTLPIVGLVTGVAVVAVCSAIFVIVLAMLLRRSIIAAFGHHLTANRAALLTATEAPLREASTRFYAALAQPLDARIASHGDERQRHEPLLTRVQQLEQTFARFAEDLRMERAPMPASDAA
jgi:hypothetical protein